jgi:hypothetical protein
MSSEHCEGASKARGVFEACACAAILLALVGGGAAAVKLCFDLLQLLVRAAGTLPS